MARAAQPVPLVAVNKVSTVFCSALLPMASGVNEKLPVLPLASYKRMSAALCVLLIVVRIIVNAWSIAAGSITVNDCAITAISGKVNARANNALSLFSANPCAIMMPISSTNWLISA